MDDIDLKNLIKTDEKKDIESALYEVLKDLNAELKAKILTELSEEDIRKITALTIISKMRKQPIYKEITSVFMLLRISKGRKSRQEILKAIKNANPESKMDRGQSQFRNLLM